MSLDRFQEDILATRAQYESGWNGSGIDAILPVSMLPEGLLESDRELSDSETVNSETAIGLVLALYMMFGHENFVKGPANLFTQAYDVISSSQTLDGLLTLIAMTYGRLGDLFVLLRYPEQLQGASREFNAELETASYRKMKDRRILLLQYLLQQNRNVTGEDKTGASECK